MPFDSLGYSLMIVHGLTLNVYKIPSRDGADATKFHHQGSPLPEQNDRLMEH